MDNKFLYDFLVSLPEAVLWLVIFVEAVLLDALYNLWMRRSVAGKKIQAANYSAILSVIGMIAIIGAVEINNLLIFVSAAGYWCGTYFTITMDEKWNTHGIK